MGKVKAWVFKEEKEIKQDYYQDFPISDKHIVLERTHGFMRFVWFVGGIACIAVIKVAASWAGIILGVLGFLGIWLVEKAFTKKMSKDLHLLCFVERDSKHDDYYALDINTDEILYVQHIFSDKDDDDTQTVYAFEPVELDFFKNVIGNASQRLYSQIEFITDSNKKALRNIQFGETVCSWINFLILNEDDVFKIGCLSIGNAGEVDARYVELTPAVYDKMFGGCDTVYDKYKIFINSISSELKDDSLCHADRLLFPDEKNEFKNIFSDMSELSDKTIEALFIKGFFNEIEHKGEAPVADLEALEFLKKIACCANDGEPAPLAEANN